MRKFSSPLRGLRSPISRPDDGPDFELPQLNHVTPGSIAYAADGNIVVTMPTFPAEATESLQVTLTGYVGNRSLGEVPQTFPATTIPGAYKVNISARAYGYAPYSAFVGPIDVGVPALEYPFIDLTEFDGLEAAAPEDSRKVTIVTAKSSPISGRVWAFARGVTTAGQSNSLDVPMSSWNFTLTLLTYNGASGFWERTSSGRFSNGQTDAAVRLALVDPADPDGPSKQWASEIKPVVISDVPDVPDDTEWSVTPAPGGFKITTDIAVDWQGRDGQVTYTVETDQPVNLPLNGDAGERFIPYESAVAVDVTLTATNANGAAISSTKSVLPEPEIVTPPPPTVTGLVASTITVGNAQFVFRDPINYVVHPGGIINVNVDYSAPVLVNKTPEVKTVTGRGTYEGVTDNGLRNGHKKNPMAQKQAWDGRLGIRDVPDAYPITFVAGDSFESAISRAENTELPRNAQVDEIAWFYFTSGLRDPARQAPAIRKWTGRADAMDAWPLVDYLAKAAELPVNYGIAGYAYHSLATVQRNFRNNPGRGVINSNNVSPGYESMSVTNPWGASSPYGRWPGGKGGDYSLYLVAPLEQVPLDVKSAILEGFDRYRIQVRTLLESGKVGNSRVYADGAHGQFDPIAFAWSAWVRGETARLDNLLAEQGGNWRDQYFTFDQALIDAWLQPWGNPDSISGIYKTNGPPNCYYKRRITAVNQATLRVDYSTAKGGSGGTQGDGQKARYQNMKLVRTQLADGTPDNTEVWVDTVEGDIDSGITTDYSCWVDQWPTPGFAVGDVIHMAAGFDIAPGDPAWRLVGGSGTNIYIPNDEASYQALQKCGGAWMALRIVGQHRDDWQSFWNYFLAAAANGPGTDYPGKSVNYPAIWESGSLTEQVWAQYKDAILAIKQPFMTQLAPPPGSLYPDVPNVDVAAAAGSMRLSETVTGSSMRQPKTNLGTPSTASVWSWAFILRRPRDKRKRNYTDSLWISGDTSTQSSAMELTYRGEQASPNPNKFEWRHRGAGSSGRSDIYSAAWTEDAALVVFNCDGLHGLSIDWYSLIDGTKHAGSVQTGSAQNAISTFAGTDIYHSWDGELELVAQVRRAVSDAEWQSIALGADFGTVIGGANVKYVRELKGDVASLAKPAWATGDTSSPATITGTQYPGSHIRKPAAAGLEIDLFSAGELFGLTAGATQMACAMSGKALGGASGGVQIKVWEETTGDVVVDWFTFATISGANWTGPVTLPEGKSMYHRAFRLESDPTKEYHDRNAFGVGWKVMAIGQSQMSICLQGGASTTLDAAGLTSYLDNQATGDGEASLRFLDSLGNGALNAFANQLRQFKPNAPIQIIRESINGTGMNQLIADLNNRPWVTDPNNLGSLMYKLTNYGADISAVVHNWGTNEGSIGETAFKTRLDAFVKGTGGDATGRYLDLVMQPGYEFVISPLTRYSSPGGGEYAYHDNERKGEVDWANAGGYTVGPPIPDLYIESAGGPHQTQSNARGSKLMAVRLAQAVAKALGWTNFQNPYFESSVINAARTAITIKVARPNGGNLYAPAPNALRGFRVDNGGVGTWQTASAGGFTARIVDNDILLEKTTGAWSAGTKWRFEPNQETRSDGQPDGTVENAILDGQVYETWASDVLGLGLPVVGAMSSGFWVPTCIQTPTTEALPINVASAGSLTLNDTTNEVTFAAPTFDVAGVTVAHTITIGQNPPVSYAGSPFTLPDDGSEATVVTVASKAGYTNCSATTGPISNGADVTGFLWTLDYATLNVGDTQTQLTAAGFPAVSAAQGLISSTTNTPYGKRLDIIPGTIGNARAIRMGPVEARLASGWSRLQIAGEFRVAATNNGECGIDVSGSTGALASFGIGLRRPSGAAKTTAYLLLNEALYNTTLGTIMRSGIADSTYIRFRLEIGSPDKKTLRIKFWLRGDTEPSWSDPAAVFERQHTADIAANYVRALAVRSNSGSTDKAAYVQQIIVGIDRTGELPDFV